MDLSNFVQKFSGLTEEYKFYNDTITLRYDPEEHVYLLVEGDSLVKQDGVTTVCHIIDKSNILIPWAAKMVAEKLLATTPVIAVDGKDFVSLPLEDYTKLVLAAKAAPKEKVEEAADIGHQAHAWIEGYIKSVLGIIEKSPDQPIDIRILNCCNAALNWMGQHNVRWVKTECKIYSKEYRYAGTMDGLAYVDSCHNPLCCPHEFKNRLSLIDWKSSNYLHIEHIIQTAAYEAAYEEEYGVDVEDRWVIRLGKTDGEFDPWHFEADTFQGDIEAFWFALNLYRVVQELEARIKERKDYLKAALKAQKQKEKEEMLKIKCKAADKYKGIRAPKCNGGNPCQTCLEKYAAVQATKGLTDS